MSRAPCQISGWLSGGGRGPVASHSAMGSWPALLAMYAMEFEVACRRVRRAYEEFSQSSSCFWEAGMKLEAVSVAAGMCQGVASGPVLAPLSSAAVGAVHVEALESDLADGGARVAAATRAVVEATRELGVLRESYNAVLLVNHSMFNSGGETVLSGDLSAAWFLHFGSGSSVVCAQQHVRRMRALVWVLQVFAGQVANLDGGFDKPDVDWALCAAALSMRRGRARDGWPRARKLRRARKMLHRAWQVCGDGEWPVHGVQVVLPVLCSFRASRWARRLGQGLLDELQLAAGDVVRGGHDLDRWLWRVFDLAGSPAFVWSELGIA